MKRIITSLVLTFLLTLPIANAQKLSASHGNTAPALKLTLPNKDNSVRFVVIGDTGTGPDKQHELAQVLMRYRQAFPFEVVLVLGGNMYGSEKSTDYKTKFEDVYRPLLDQKVKFYAALGNHDESNQRFYEFFNMEGQEDYRFTKGNVSFYSL